MTTQTATKPRKAKTPRKPSRLSEEAVARTRQRIARDQIVSAAEHASSLAWLRERHADDGLSQEDGEARLEYWMAAIGGAS